MRSVVKEINGHMVGLVGYITPHTKFISNSGKVMMVMIMMKLNCHMLTMITFINSHMVCLVDFIKQKFIR